MKNKNYYYQIYWSSETGKYNSDLDGFTTENYQEALTKRNYFMGEKGYFTIFKIEKQTENEIKQYTWRTY